MILQGDDFEFLQTLEGRGEQIGDIADKAGREDEDSKHARDYIQAQIKVRDDDIRGYYAENEDDGACETCGGYGWIETTNTAEDGADTEQPGLYLEVVPCPDCALVISGIGTVGGMGFSYTCPDCLGTGLENYTHGECPDCNGKGYTTNG